MNALKLREAGIDYEAGVSRFLGDRELYEAVLAAFLSDTTLDTALRAMDAGDREALFRCAHELKGSSGNADMTRLYAASCTLVALLRGAATDAELLTAFGAFKSVYLGAREGILSAMKG